MAIIKCPECGHQISDKAPTCPSCGVEIAGKIEKCAYCGEVYFRDEGFCPHCHKAAKAVPTSANAVQQTPVAPRVENDKPQQAPETPNGNENGKGKKGGNASILIISVIIASIVLGVCAYIYNNAQSDKEREEYEFAISSDDPMVLQAYLDNFKSAPQEHIDSINAHLERLKAQDIEWTNALVSNSKNALTTYLKNHPDSPHKAEALSKIDSIDWAQCTQTKTSDAYQAYIDNHADGSHYDEAQMALKELLASTVSPEERQAVISVFRQFFMSINEKDEANLTSTVSDIINFLGKATATKTDIISFMHKLYKPEVRNLVWSISKNFKIDKTEVGDGVYEYSVTFMADQKVTKTDDTTTDTPFRISATIDSDGKISDMSMTKIVE